MNTLLLTGVIAALVLFGVGLYWSGEDDTTDSLQPVPAQQEVVPPSAVLPSSDTTSSAPASPRTHAVTLRDFAFVPASLIIASGDRVVWTNEDGASHTVTSDSGKELASSLFGRGKTYEHTFTTPGTYTYHCGPHGAMKGTIVVQ